MNGVNVVDWLNAIDRHRETTDSDLLVAVALTNDDPVVSGVDPEEVEDSVTALLDLGFLERAVTVELDEGLDEPGYTHTDDHLLLLRLP